MRYQHKCGHVSGQQPGNTPSGHPPGIEVSSEESAEIKRLKRENAELRRANEILKAASAFFAAELCATRRRGDRVEVGDLRRQAVAAA